MMPDSNQPMRGFAHVLFNWQPSKLEAGTIEKEFGALLSALGVRWDADSSIAPRSPQENLERARTGPGFDGQMDSTVWHQDGGEGFHPYALIFWSNRLLPNVREIATHRLLATRPGDVILVRNRIAEHHLPATEVLDTSDRWLCQAWISHEQQLGVPGLTQRNCGDS